MRRPLADIYLLFFPASSSRVRSSMCSVLEAACLRVVDTLDIARSIFHDCVCPVQGTGSDLGDLDTHKVLDFEDESICTSG